MFVESSSPRVQGERALIASPYIPTSKLPDGACVTFWYHMYGVDIETLNIYVEASAFAVSPTNACL